MTQVVKDGDFYVASYVTGPTHNLLRLKLRAGNPADDFEMVVLPPVGACRHHGSLAADEIVPHIRVGVERANAELRSSFGVERAEIIENDSRQPPVYELLAHRIIREAASRQLD